MKRDIRSPVQLHQPAPHVDPAVSARHPAAASYADGLAARRVGAPRGGGPPPPIPPLNAPHTEHMTMADQATAMRTPPQAPPQGTIFSPEAAMHQMASRQNGILVNDLLPDMARKDPLWQEGHGSAFAVNQPQLARKYGVIRNGKMVPPQELATGKPGLSPRTVEGLKELSQFQEQRKNAESGDAAAERASMESPAGEAAKLAGGDPKPVTPEQREEAERTLKEMDEFDFNAFREMMMKDLINNEAQRKIVEDRLKPLDISELIMNGRVKQTVPIIPNKYEPTFQSLTGEEELALRRLILQDKHGVEGSDRYILDKFQMMTIAACLVRINDQVLPSHEKNGNFDDDAFWVKFNKVVKYPLNMLASLGVHFYWFDIRVRKLFVAERLTFG